VILSSYYHCIFPFWESGHKLKNVNYFPQWVLLISCVHILWNRPWFVPWFSFVTLFPKQCHGFHQEVEYKIYHSIMNLCRILPKCQALYRVFCVPCFISCISPTSCYLYIRTLLLLLFKRKWKIAFWGTVSEDILILSCLIRHPVPFQENPRWWSFEQFCHSKNRQLWGFGGGVLCSTGVWVHSLSLARKLLLLLELLQQPQDSLITVVFFSCFLGVTGNSSVWHYLYTL
jgi:hypothetical protein